MRLDGAADTIFIVWTDQPGDRRTIEFAKRDLISVTDLMGKAVKWKDRPGGQARVEIDDAAGPVYFLWTTGVRPGAGRSQTPQQ